MTPSLTATRTEGKPAPPRYVSFPDFIPGREIMVRPQTTRLHLTPFPPAVILDDRIPREELALVTLGIV